MRTIKVDDMYECPFQYNEVYQISKFSAGSDVMCSLLKAECWQKNCPLKKEDAIKVIQNVEEQENEKC